MIRREQKSRKGQTVILGDFSDSRIPLQGNGVAPLIRLNRGYAAHECHLVSQSNVISIVMSSSIR